METLNVSVDGNFGMVEVTGMLNDLVRKSDVVEGILLAFVDGSTGALVTLEDEIGLIDDFKKMVSELIPDKKEYKHDQIDNNAVSHLRASLLGPSIVIPISNGKLLHGMWQQVFLVNFDKRKRERTIKVKLID